MLPEIFCISPSMPSKRDDLPQPTCPTIIVSWPARQESIYKLLAYQMLMEKHLILYIWCHFVPCGIRISMLDNAGGPSGVQVKNPFVICAKMERSKELKTRFTADFFYSASETLSIGTELAFTQCRNLWTQTSTTIRKLWKIPEGKVVAVDSFFCYF